MTLTVFFNFNYSFFVQATAETNNLILYMDCFNLYTNSMQTALIDVEPYFSQSKFMELHETVKNLSMFEV